MIVSDALASAFVKEGVDTVFGLMGNGNMFWWHAMEQNHDITFHETRHEGTALSMAEGWARATGKVGVCAVTQGPGLTQLATALTVASRAKVPLVVFAGETAFNDHDSVQKYNQAKFVDATEAGFVPIMKASEAEDAVRMAFYRARIESRPIVLNAPMDIQAETYTGDVDQYEPSSTLLPGYQRILPDPDRLADAVKTIAEAKKPVIVVGQGAKKADAGDAVIKLADRIGAVIATSLPTKGWLGEHEYHVGVSGGYALKTAVDLFAEADVMIGVGASLNPHTLDKGQIYPNAKIIQIDLQPSIVMGSGKRADHYLRGDAKLTIEAIDQQLESKGVQSTGFRTAEVRGMLAEWDPDPREFQIDDGTVDPRRVATILDDVLPSDVGVVHGTGHCSGITAFFMRKPRDLTWAINTFGCIGQAVPTAIGAAAAFPDKAMAVVEGDAGTLMHAAELDTVARMGVKLLIAVFNDEALGAEYQKFVSKKMKVGSSAIASPDLGAVARAFGLRGAMCTTLEQVQAGVDEFMAGDGPMLLDIRVSRNVVSVPYSRQWFGLAI